MVKDRDKTLIKLIQLACVCLFLGRGVTFLMEFDQTFIDHTPLIAVKICGIILIAAAIILLVYKHVKRTFVVPAIIIASAVLSLHSIIAAWYSSFPFAQMIEHSLQLGTPIVLIRLIYTPDRIDSSYKVLLCLSVLTFVGHGLFALGIPEIPHSFLKLTSSIIGLNPEYSSYFLAVFGILDLIMLALLFKIPNIPIKRILIGYMIIWGGITTLSRVTSGMISYNLFSEDLLKMFTHTLYRIVHFIIPMVLFLILKRVHLKEFQHKVSN
ncbi:MAG: hypothetical protein MK078_11190 [Crocinitomicaceae bacterium]|nr:hypothetical protein [Crocinitomicaceae bacterium]